MPISSLRENATAFGHRKEEDVDTPWFIPVPLEAIVRATIDMLHYLKREVVAEGVKTEQHFEFLREHQCDEPQGHLFGRPQSPSSFDNMFDSMQAERQRLIGLRSIDSA